MQWRNGNRKQIGCLETRLQLHGTMLWVQQLLTSHKACILPAAQLLFFIYHKFRGNWVKWLLSKREVRLKLSPRAIKKKSWHRNLTFPNHRQSCRCSPLWGMSASSECCHANLFTTITTLIPGYRVCLSLCTRVQAECITLTARRCVCFSVESGPRVLLVPPQPPVIDCSRGTARINQWVRTKLPS